MKSKIIISILLAVLMLGTLATPAFAGKPAKGDLLEWTGGVSGEPVTGTETGKVSLQRTRDNHIKLSLVLRDATPDARYYIRLNNSAAYWDDVVTPIYANSRGVLRVRLTSKDPMNFTTMSIVVKEDPLTTDWDFGTYPMVVPLN